MPLVFACHWPSLLLLLLLLLSFNLCLSCLLVVDSCIGIFLFGAVGCDLSLGDCCCQLVLIFFGAGLVFVVGIFFIACLLLPSLLFACSLFVVLVVVAVVLCRCSYWLWCCCCCSLRWMVVIVVVYTSFVVVVIFIATFCLLLFGRPVCANIHSNICDCLLAYEIDIDIWLEMFACSLTSSWLLLLLLWLTSAM